VSVIQQSRQGISARRESKNQQDMRAHGIGQDNRLTGKIRDLRIAKDGLSDRAKHGVAESGTA